MNVTAILTSDMHIRSTVPKCRTDDFLGAMIMKLNFIIDLANEHDCPILVAGDIGDKSEWPDWLLTETIRVLKRLMREMYCIPGQHDLPNHSMELLEKSGIQVLVEASCLSILHTPFLIRTHRTLSSEIKKVLVHPFPYGKKIAHTKIPMKAYPNVAVAHQMVRKRKTEDYPDQGGERGVELLKKFPEYNLILTGDNHKPFVVEHGDRVLVNSGSMLRTTAGQEDHKPRVYLWDAKTNKVEPVYLPIEKGVVNREHIVKVEERNERIEVFVRKLKTDYDVSLSFEDNLVAYFRKNKTDDPVTKLVWECVGEAYEKYKRVIENEGGDRLRRKRTSKGGGKVRKPL